MWHVLRLQDEHATIDFQPLLLNLERVKELIVTTYHKIGQTEFHNLEMIKMDDFRNHLEQEFSQIQKMYSMKIKNELRDIDFPLHSSTLIEKKLLRQILENIFDNSYKFDSDLMIVRLISVEDNVVLEIIDNGKEEKYKASSNANIPNGIGTKLMKDHAAQFIGKVTWRKRMDRRGMIVRLYLTHVILD